MKDSKFGQFLKKNGAVMFSICGILVIAVAVMLIVNGSIKESEVNPEQEHHVDLNEMAEGEGAEDSSQFAQGEIKGEDEAQLAEGDLEGENQPQVAQDEAGNEGAQVADSAQSGGQLTSADAAEGDLPPKARCGHRPVDV